MFNHIFWTICKWAKYRSLLIYLFLFVSILGVLAYYFFSTNDQNDGVRIVSENLRSGQGFTRIDEKELTDLPNSDFVSFFNDLERGFKSINLSLKTDTVLAAEKIKKKTIFDDHGKQVISSYELKDIVIRTEYIDRDTGDNNQSLDSGGVKNIKQAIYIKNEAKVDKLASFRLRNEIDAQIVTWEGQDYELNKHPQAFKAHKKTAGIPEYANDIGADMAGLENFKNYEHTYITGANVFFKTKNGQIASYDWSDAIQYDPVVYAWCEDGERCYLEIVFENIALKAGEEKVIDPNYVLSDADNYDARIDGMTIGADINFKSGSVVVMGDVNGDGIDDLVIGDPYSELASTDSGFVFIVFGSISISEGDKKFDIEEDYNIRYEGAASYDYLSEFRGIVVGDVNGDTYSDLILSAYSADNNGNLSGSAYVIFSTLIDDVGVSTGNHKSLASSTSYNIRYDGANMSDYLTRPGSILVEDINGDSDQDLVLGAYNADIVNINTGSVYVIFSTLIDDVGASTGNNKSLATSTNYNIRYNGVDIGDFLGVVISAGDVNGDNISDLILGGDGVDDNGFVYVMFSTLIDDVGVSTGNNKSLATSTNYNIRYEGAAIDDYLSWGGMLIEDINGDTYSDLILGAPDADFGGTYSGSAYVIFSTLIDDVGASTGNDKSLATSTNYNIRYDGVAIYDYLTESKNMFAGDVNGDTYPDLIIGAYSADNNGSYSGSAWVMFSTLIDDVGASTGNNKSLATSTNYNIRYDGVDNDDNLTENCAIMVDDINGDGYSDLVLGAPYADFGGTYSGSVWVMFSTLIDDVGVSTGNNKSLAVPTNYNIRYDAVASNDYLTRPGNIFAGDIDGDTYSDLIFGAAYSDLNGNNSGSTYVVFSTLIDDVGVSAGNNKSLASSTSYNIRYDGSSKQYLQLTIDGALRTGDVNGDDVDDLIIGSYNSMYNGIDSGSVWIIFGETGFGGEKSLDISSNYNIRYDGVLGSMLSKTGSIIIGDVNDDGFNDLVLGAAYTDYNGTNCGSAYVIFSTLIDDVGTTNGNIISLASSSAYNIRYDGNCAGDGDYLTLNPYGYVGTPIIGDVNGDGASDLIIGAYQADNNGVDSGSAWVMFSTLIDDVGASTGNNKSLASSANYNIRYDGSGAGDSLGINMVAGDLNGDYLGDLVIGAPFDDQLISNSGSAFVIFSTLIDDVGATTGNNFSLADTNNFNIQFHAAGSSWTLSADGILIGDVNGDRKGDLVFGMSGATFSSVSALGAAYIMFSTYIDDVGTTTGNIRAMHVGSSYNIRYVGAITGDRLFLGGADIGDVNGDGLNDLVLGASLTDYNGVNSGSAYVMFSTLVDDVGETTGNSKSLGTITNYNIRYDGTVSNALTHSKSLKISDVNGDGLGDLVLGSDYSDFNGDNSGSVYVVFSTSIDDVGATTGNNKPLSNVNNYNIRYDGPPTGYLSSYNNIIFGDINNDDYNDLIIGAYYASNNGNNSGSVYVVFSQHEAYYSIGQNTNDHKTGSPTITIATGTAAFSVAQTATNMGVGDRVSYNQSSISSFADGGGGLVLTTTASAHNFTTGDYVAIAGTTNYNGIYEISVNDSSSFYFNHTWAGNDAAGTATNIAFLKLKNNTSSWRVIGLRGREVNNISAASVVSITHEFSSLSSAISQASSTNYLGTDDLSSSLTRLNLACYYDSGPDAGPIKINSWTQSKRQNIHIYTPIDTVKECNQSQRHMGTSTISRFALEYSGSLSGYNGVIDNQSEFTEIEGLQIKLNVSVANKAAVYSDKGMRLSHSIIRKDSAVSDTANGINIDNIPTGQGAYLFNNIVYDFNDTGDNGFDLSATDDGSIYLYANTATDNTNSYVTGSDDTIAKNNLSQNATDGYSGTFHSDSDYNLSDLDSDAPGENSYNLVSIIFKDEANDDFHLYIDDLTTRYWGSDLNNDIYISIVDDIDGHLRNYVEGMDIGADQGLMRIYRSVAFGATTALVSGSGFSVSNNLITFNSDLPLNVGIGDAIQYTTNGGSVINVISFIYKRIDNKNFLIYKADGTSPLSGFGAYSVFRAYTSLANAEGGSTENTGINSLVREFADWTGGRDLVANNEQWNIVLYKNGTTNDTTAATINGWTTSPNNYLKIYTPVSETEVGESQRHNGTIDTGYKRRVSGNSIVLYDVDLWIDGLEIEDYAGGGGVPIYNSSTGNRTFRISNNLIHYDGHQGIYINGGSNTYKIWNNIFYGNHHAISTLSTRPAYIYNNTFFFVGTTPNNYTAINGGANTIAKNNIALNYGNGSTYFCYTGTLNAQSDYNLSSDNSASGANSIKSSDVIFQDEAAYDFHLSQLGEIGINDGVNLSTDEIIIISDDIDGETRGPVWDMGADEVDIANFRIKGFMKMNGKVRFE